MRFSTQHGVDVPNLESDCQYSLCKTCIPSINANSASDMDACLASKLGQRPLFFVLLPVPQTKMLFPLTFFAEKKIVGKSQIQECAHAILKIHMPILPTFRRQHPRATLKTHANNRRLNTYFCRTPPLIKINFHHYY